MDKVYKLRYWRWQGEGKPWLDVEQDYTLEKGIIAERVIGRVEDGRYVKEAEDNGQEGREPEEDN